ncbi:2-dehydropantoate 2-reductase N-terminal domain-containing protein [Catenulispora yoronensis]
MADIAVVGPGAIGSVAALAAQQAGRHNVTLCARRDPGRSEWSTTSRGRSPS